MTPLYICGPTAVGKTAIALQLAQRINGEIISVDSMQVYRGMDIGTAKPTRHEQNLISHHLIDVADLTETFDAARFVNLAKAAETEIISRRKVPVYCGGTGLYFNALLHGLGDAPASDPAIRAELEATPLHSLLEELQKTDPTTWEKIDRCNPRRIIRALEVIRITKKPFSEQRADWRKVDVKIFGIERRRDDLHQRINSRVDEMFRHGLIEETRHLLEHGLRENRTACQALGYKQVIELLDQKLTRDDTIELVKLRTRQFAKRQLTWFKRQLPCQWLNADSIDIDKLI